MSVFLLVKKKKRYHNDILLHKEVANITISYKWSIIPDPPKQSHHLPLLHHHRLVLGIHPHQSQCRSVFADGRVLLRLAVNAHLFAEKVGKYPTFLVM